MHVRDRRSVHEFVRRRTHCCSDATDAMNKFSELLSALGALHAKEGSRHSETMRALGKNYSLEDDVTLIAQHWERLASEKHHLSKHKLTKSEKCRMTRLRTELSPELAARVLPKLVSRSEREVLLASVSLFTSRSALETRMRDRDLGKQPELEHVVMAASRRVGLQEQSRRCFVALNFPSCVRFRYIIKYISLQSRYDPHLRISRSHKCEVISCGDTYLICPVGGVSAGRDREITD